MLARIVSDRVQLVQGTAVKVVARFVGVDGTEFVEVAAPDIGPTFIMRRDAIRQVSSLEFTNAVRRMRGDTL